MKVRACQHFFQQENWLNGTVFVIFSNRHMGRCFLHYLVILLIRLSDQNVRFQIKILRKFTVTQFFLKDRSEGKVPNSAIDIVSTGGSSPFTVGTLIFMHNIWCMDSIFVYNHHHVILNSHMLRVLKRLIVPSGGDGMLMRTWHNHVVQALAGWKLLTFRYFWKISCHFVSFLVFIQFKRQRTFCGKEIHTNYRMWKLFTWPDITPSTFSEHLQNGVSFEEVIG